MDILGVDKKIDHVEQAADHVIDHASEEGVKVIKIGFDWLDTHRLKLSGSGTVTLTVEGNVFLELVPKTIGPTQG